MATEQRRLSNDENQVRRDNGSKEIVWSVQDFGFSSVGDGRETVTTAGTAVQMSNVPCKRVFVQAESDNTGAIVVGGSTVVAAEGTQRGLRIYPSQGQWFYVSNLNLLYIDSEQNGDGINYYYEE